MTTRLSRTNRSERTAAFDTIGHGSHGAFFGSFRFVPPAMIIAETIDVGFATRRAGIRIEIARSPARTMRIGVTLDAIRSVAMRCVWSAGDQTANVVAAYTRHRVARTRATLRVAGAPHALRSCCGLSFAIRRVTTATVATRATTFVTCARVAYAAQTESAVAAIAVLAAFCTSSPDRTRQTEGITRHLHAIDDYAFERNAIDAGITAAVRRIVLRKRTHAATHGQIAHASFAFGIRRAFNAKRLTIGFNGRAFHLRSELTIRTTIARCACTRIRRRTRLTTLTVARFAFRTIRIVVAFIAGFRNRIACKTARAISIRPTSTAFDVAIQVYTERRVATAR